MTFLYLFAGLIVGIILGWVIALNKQHSTQQKLNDQTANLEKENLLKLAEAEKQKGIIQERLNLLQEESVKVQNELFTERERAAAQADRLARSEEIFRNMQEKLSTQKQEMEDLQTRFSAEFKNLANEILKQNSREFTEANVKNLGEILNPLKENLTDFRKMVKDAYENETRDKVSLKQEVRSLFDLNRKLSQDAENLTKALKGDVKKQGNWGEIILERVLERSGLTKGVEYETQFTARNEQGSPIRPDVIIRLPDNKHIIIDSKVTLVAYEAFVNAESQDDRDRYLKQHIEALRSHIKGLSEKKYQSAELFDSPDFVLLFMPVEAAFSTAIQTDVELFNFAWERKIVIVSPTTLLATLRTIASIWKQEKQTQNALEIARHGGNLYDKFVSFLEDMKKISTQLNTLQNTFSDAEKKLSTGSGNLIGRVEKLRELGVKVSKVIPDKYRQNGELLEEENE